MSRILSKEENDAINTVGDVIARDLWVNAVAFHQRYGKEDSSPTNAMSAMLTSALVTALACAYPADVRANALKNIHRNVRDTLIRYHADTNG